MVSLLLLQLVQDLLGDGGQGRGHVEGAVRETGRGIDQGTVGTVKERESVREIRRKGVPS